MYAVCTAVQLQNWHGQLDILAFSFSKTCNDWLLALLFKKQPASPSGGNSKFKFWAFFFSSLKASFLLLALKLPLLTMYDFHHSTDIFVNPSFLPFCTHKAPWISSKNGYLGAKSCVWPSWIQNQPLRPYMYNTHLKHGVYMHYKICPKMSVESWKLYIVWQWSAAIKNSHEIVISHILMRIFSC